MCCKVSQHAVPTGEAAETLPGFRGLGAQGLRGLGVRSLGIWGFRV